MKNRRITLAAFLLIAVLVMGIGFAAVADNLNISGAARVTNDATATVFDSKIYFSAASKLSGTGTAAGATDTIEITGAQKDAVEFHVNTLALINEQTKFKITIKNESDQYDATITIDNGQPSGSITNPTGKTLGDYFEIIYSTDPDSTVTTEISCPAGGTVDVYVTLKLTSSPDVTVDASFTSHLTATSAPKAVAP